MYKLYRILQCMALYMPNGCASDFESLITNRYLYIFCDN